jgi:hypothetical protein
VDVESMACSIAVDMGAAKEWHDVPLPAPAGAGPRSWAGCVPEPGTRVLIEWSEFGFRNFKPQITGFLAPGITAARQYEPFAACDPEEAAQALALSPDLADDPRYRLDIIRMKNRKAYSGDFLASSSQGSDFVLDRDVTLQNRAGNELKLRDSDQTTVLQTVNEFVSSAAGFYRRGLIKRNAFNLLPDLLLSAPDRTPGEIDGDPIEAVLADKTKTLRNEDGSWDNVLVDGISTNSSAFSILHQFGLVDSGGKVTFDQTKADYPFVVMSDGRRQSYVVQNTHDKRWDEVDECYVEDRAEIFHTHDGVMSVTEEGDGIQIDNALKRVFIEDVRGTVVGNDPYTDAGRSLYKRILSMSMFSSPDDVARPDVRMFDVDVVNEPSQADSIALARLFRISPIGGGSSEYVFGVTKEGRVFWNVPASRNEAQSVDLNTDGGIQAFLGCNQNRVSLNLKTLGGVKLDLGSFLDTSSDSQDPVSVDVTFRGKVKTNYTGLQGRETIVAGTEYVSVGGSHVVSAASGQVVVCGGTSALEAEGARRNIGTGGYVLRSLGPCDVTCLDKSSESYSKLRTTTTHMGSTKTTVTGTDSTIVTAGAYTIAVTSGTYSVTVGAGALNLMCGASASVMATANLGLMAGGSVMTSAGGANTSMAAGTNTMSGSVDVIAAPVVKIGMSIVGNVVAGIPGPPGPHRDFITGMPILGHPTTFVG